LPAGFHAVGRAVIKPIRAADYGADLEKITPSDHYPIGRPRLAARMMAPALGLPLACFPLGAIRCNAESPVCGSKQKTLSNTTTLPGGTWCY
jgi:hypothetical protein